MCLLCVSVMSASAWGQELTTAYTLTPTSGTNNAYASNCDITINGITWNLTGNSTTQPWRIGGKSLTNTNRTLYSKTAIDDDIVKISVTHGAASNITVNSFSLGVYSDADFKVEVETQTKTFEANSTIDFTPSPGKSWDGCYYKFTYNVTVSVNSNKFIEFSEAVFYKESGGGGGSSAVATTTTIDASGITNTDVYVGTAAGSLSANVTETESGDDVDGATVTWSGNNDAVATINATTGAVTLVGEGTVTFTATYAGDASYSSSSNTYKMTVVDNTPATAIAILSVYSGTTYAMTTTVDKTAGAVEVQVIDGKVVANPADVASITWYIRSVSGGYVIKNASGKYLTNSSTELSLSDSPQTWTLNASNQLLSGTRGLVYRDAQSGFRAYATSNAGKDDYGTVGVKYEEFAYTRTTAAGNYGTICLPYDATVAGAKLYTIVGKEITGSEVTALLLDEVASIEAGKPYIFKATASDVVATYTGTTYTAASAVNGLYGTYSAIAAGGWGPYVSGDLYLLTTSNVQAADKTSSSLAANRAYIVLDEVNNIGSPVKGVRLGFDGTEEATAITKLTESTEKTEGTEGIYNLNGQQLSAPQRGINIIGGKKVLVK